ncbi:GGDEF domain-containing protein [Candidatus Saccharibacteria bacterium]|nr:GGDEF domain-containing protein [Candidatus Saccharibacteria bacterium]
MVQKVLNVLFYAGADVETLEKIKPKIREMNRIMTTVLSLFATFLIFAMYITSFKTESVHQNQIVYKVGFGLSVLIFLMSVSLAKKVPSITIVLVYLSYVVYYMYGILIGTITDPTGKTVTFMVMLVFLPTLFVDRPLNSIGITIFYVSVFIGLCLVTKDESVMSVDIIDAIIFGILGAASGVVFSCIRVRSYITEEKLKEIGRIDQLTQVRNRNAYELERNEIPEKCKSGIGCVFMDVNGLHELNNEEGYDSGDLMLKFVAEQLKYRFYDGYVYRIGGDEFVVFIPDPDERILKQELSIVIENIHDEGYEIASGYSLARIYRLSLDTLIRNAEERMKEDKRRFYAGTMREMRNESHP